MTQETTYSLRELLTPYADKIVNMKEIKELAKKIRDTEFTASEKAHYALVTKPASWVAGIRIGLKLAFNEASREWFLDNTMESLQGKDSYIKVSSMLKLLDMVMSVDKKPTSAMQSKILLMTACAIALAEDFSDEEKRLEHRIFTLSHKRELEQISMVANGIRSGFRTEEKRYNKANKNKIR